ncbi:TetR/AcrR family transcriptional regulator [Actinomadura harenae]|uniref:TetR family transcriptional regulator n=1 Tax=Actinomadura harenae TaxID=2483351 RepID=A0A3M2LEX0_9ACTN|nr:TetR family transcriptional regulator C-terminal domain-containing protein [Actinomadura harenae]RMI36061.1 TetR family transcriptional regulator [Actinomadura harenae]
MPKMVDPEERRREVAEAIFRVARRDGLDHASLRAVAAEAGLAIGSVRHYFDGQADLMIFAMRYFADRAGSRIREAATRLKKPAPDAPASEHVATLELLLAEILPLDESRREEAEVWLAFITAARTRPDLAPYARELFDELAAMLDVLLAAADRLGALRPDLDLHAERVRLNALLDGLTLHAVLQPDRIGPPELTDALRHHITDIAAVPPEGPAPR